jgi:hypothetical protein
MCGEKLEGWNPREETIGRQRTSELATVQEALLS